MTSARPSYDGVVLAGGSSRRMNVPDKTRLTVAGRSMLDRVVEALDGAAQVVVVGEQRPTAHAVSWTREDPPGGGPAAALGAALACVSAPYVVLLAADLPLIRRSDVDGLVTRLEAGAADGVVLVDDGGRRQWLCGAWRADALRAADLRADAALHRALEGLTIETVPVPAGSRAALGCDTPEDLRRAEELS
jgi:molybdenum cofactor guanylyltransferase